MKLLAVCLALAALVAGADGAELLPVEKEVAELVQAARPTVVHFWAPWCPNCYGELKSKGWSTFINENPKVNVIFVTTWSGTSGDGREMLAKLGVGPQPNFKLLFNPNTSRRDEDKTASFLEYPLRWLPATWVFSEGKLRYALNYGEVRFPVLQQLVKDAANKWE